MLDRPPPGPAQGHEARRYRNKQAGRDRCDASHLPPPSPPLLAQGPGDDASTQLGERFGGVAGVLFEPLQRLGKQRIALRFKFQIAGFAPSAVARQVVDEFHGRLFPRQIFRLRLPFWM